MIYDSDQCMQCGGIRVTGSTLCVRCLLALRRKNRETIIEGDTKIRELEGKNKKLTALCEQLLDHITSQVLYSGAFEEWMAGARKIVKKEMDDGKNGI